ncbi:MAG: hypothetical protein ACFFDK_10175 [Promethearchaeota archaeon]
MSARLKDFLRKIHDPKSNLPLYATIIIRPGKNLLDFKIRKEESNILKVIAHESDRRGWFLHSYHIPIINLGLPGDSNTNNKEILGVLNNPREITRDKATRNLMEELLRKYIEILSQRKKHYFRTKRFKKKKEFKTGTQLKGF